MRILFVGPPLYGLLYPVLSLAQAFRVNGHEVLIASGGQFAQKAAEAGLVVFDAAPGLDSEAGYRHHEAQRKKSNIGTQMGNFSFFSEEMADHLVEFAGHWRPDLIIYPPLGVIGPLIAALFIACWNLLSGREHAGNTDEIDEEFIEEAKNSRNE